MRTGAPLTKTNFASEPLEDINDFAAMVVNHFIQPHCDDAMTSVEKYECQQMLEISPFVSPRFAGSDKVKYFDVLSREGLIQKAIDLKEAYYLDMLTKLRDDFEIDYVEPHGNLEIIDRKFYTVYSANNLVRKCVFFIALCNNYSRTELCTHMYPFNFSPPLLLGTHS